MQLIRVIGTLLSKYDGTWWIKMCRTNFTVMWFVHVFLNPQSPWILKTGDANCLDDAIVRITYKCCFLWYPLIWCQCTELQFFSPSFTGVAVPVVSVFWATALPPPWCRYYEKCNSRHINGPLPFILGEDEFAQCSSYRLRYMTL